MDVLGLITAAGKSTRMGGYPKPLLWFDGKRFVERILHSYAKAGVENRLVVLGHEAEVVRERIDTGSAMVHTNDDYESGMLSSVQIGVRRAQALGTEAMYLWPVDYPCVRSAVVKQLWETFRETGSDIVIPTCEGERGHPALFGNETFAALLEAPESEGARAVVYDDHTDVTDLEINDERILVDIDTPNEYWDAVKRYGAGSASENEEKW